MSFVIFLNGYVLGFERFDYARSCNYKLLSVSYSSRPTCYVEGVCVLLAVGHVRLPFPSVQIASYEGALVASAVALRN